MPQLFIPLNSMDDVVIYKKHFIVFHVLIKFCYLNFFWKFYCKLFWILNWKFHVQFNYKDPRDTATRFTSWIPSCTLLCCVALLFRTISTYKSQGFNHFKALSKYISYGIDSLTLLKFQVFSFVLTFLTFRIRSRCR